MDKAWSSIEEVPYCFSRSCVKWQGHKALKIVEFDPNWAFPDSNSSFNSPMAMKCCAKLETAKERCPIVFQGHPSNFKVTRDKTSPILTQIGRFRTIGRSQLSNPSDLPCLTVTISYVGDLLHYNNDITYTSWHLKLLKKVCLYSILLRLTTKKMLHFQSCQNGFQAWGWGYKYILKRWKSSWWEKLHSRASTVI